MPPLPSQSHPNILLNEITSLKCLAQSEHGCPVNIAILLSPSRKSSWTSPTPQLSHSPLSAPCRSLWVFSAWVCPLARPPYCVGSHPHHHCSCACPWWWWCGGGGGVSSQRGFCLTSCLFTDTVSRFSRLTESCTKRETLTVAYWVKAWTSGSTRPKFAFDHLLLINL